MRVNRRTSGGLGASEVDAQLRQLQLATGQAQKVKGDNGVWLKARRNSDSGLMEVWDGSAWSGPELITDRLDALEAITPSPLVILPMRVTASNVTADSTSARHFIADLSSIGTLVGHTGSVELRMLVTVRQDDFVANTCTLVVALYNVTDSAAVANASVTFTGIGNEAGTNVHLEAKMTGLFTPPSGEKHYSLQFTLTDEANDNDNWYIEQADLLVYAA